MILAAKPSPPLGSPGSSLSLSLLLEGGGALADDSVREGGGAMAAPPVAARMQGGHSGNVV